MSPEKVEGEVERGGEATAGGPATELGMALGDWIGDRRE